jgi:hypothetical protein
VFHFSLKTKTMNSELSSSSVLDANNTEESGISPSRMSVDNSSTNDNDLLANGFINNQLSVETSPTITTTFDISSTTTTTTAESDCKRVADATTTTPTKRLITIKISYKSEKQVGKVRISVV